MATPNSWYSVPHVQTDSVSCITWSPGPAMPGAATPEFLASGAWDGEIRVWQVQTNPSAQSSLHRFHANPLVALKHEAPVLSVALTRENQLFSGGCDGQIKMAQLGQATTMTAVAKHDAGVKFMHFVPENNILMTGGWDKKVKYWDVRQGTKQVGEVQLPERVYCGDVRGKLAVIGCAGRSVAIINLDNPMALVKTEESPLKEQTRSVSCFSDATGYAIGSIEGRGGIQNLQNPPGPGKSANFTFRCHRDGNNIYAVNAIAFHPTVGTFATGGSDGKVNFWDKDAKQRLHSFNDKVSQQIVDLKFNSDGNILAIVDSYDWSRGPSGYNKNLGSHIYLHNPMGEILRKTK